MARAFKLNKSELTRLRREQKMYSQFLPVLKLKQEQLQVEALRIHRELLQIGSNLEELRRHHVGLLAVLPDVTPYDIISLCRAEHVGVISKSIAGVRVPVLQELIFNKLKIDLFGTPSWMIRGLSILRQFTTLNIELSIKEEQGRLIARELKKASQKVNLFEKVLLPEALAAIKKIKIALGDEQVANVGRGKIAKKRSSISLNNSEASEKLVVTR